MEICDNGVIREMTTEELTALEESYMQYLKSNAKYEAQERHRPLTLDEVNTMLIKAQINTLTVDDQTAHRMRKFYPEWQVDTAYTSANGKPVGYKVTKNGRLWKLRQDHTSQADWEPGAVGTESLWEEICEEHDGTLHDPIPYSGNMALTAGLYYTQGGVTYLCNRDTGNPVYNALSELVGIYVTVVETI